MALLTLKTFESAIDAHLLRSRLSNEGIMSFIFDENIMTLNPLYNITVGGIKLMVPEADYESAMQILSRIEATPFRDENNNIVVCPSCGSGDFYQSFKSFKGLGGTISAVITLLLTIFPLYFKSAYKCKSCGYEFQINK